MKRICICVVVALMGCEPLPSGAPPIPITYTPMDATPFLNQPEPPLLQSGMKVCPNGMVVQQYYLC